MNTWLSLLAVLGAAFLAAASPVTVGGTCGIDDFNLSESTYLFTHAVRIVVEPCFKRTMTEDLMAHFREAKDLGDFRDFYKEFCPHVSQVTTCMAEERAGLTHCPNKDLSATFMILSELSEHLLTAGCVNDGEQLIYISHAAYLFTKKPDALAIPLRWCFHKAMAFIDLATKNEIDLASNSYIFYKDTARLKRCTEHVEDEAYKSAAEWMMDEMQATMKCKHPEEERVVPCSEVDAGKVPISDVCQMEPLNQEEDLYDHLEMMLVKGCYKGMFDHDEREISNHTDLAWLKEDYKATCLADRDMPACVLTLSAYGEACLSRQEDKQFQLQILSLDGAWKRACAEDGAQLAEVMHYVYAATPEHGHAVRDCYKSIVEAAKTHQGHTLSTKTMRFYHDGINFWQCIVGNVHDRNDLVQIVEAMMNDALKNNKCVNPEDGIVVPCELIHDHQH